MTEHKKLFFEHLADFRQLILTIAGLVMVSSIVVHIFRKDIFHFLLLPLGDNPQPLQFLSPLDPIFFILKIDFTFGILFVLPILFYLIWRFMAPDQTVRSWWVPFCFIGSATLLGAIAVAYAYLLVVPLVLNYMTSIVISGTTTAFTAQGYINFLLTLTGLLIFIFQAPLIIVTLSIARLIDPKTLSSQRRYIYIGTFIATAIITPTTDAITLLIIALPSLVVIECGLLIARLLR